MPNAANTKLDLASFALSGRRVGAALIDLIAFAAVAAGVCSAGLAIVQPRGWDGLAYALWFTLLGFALSIVLQAFCLWKRDGTLGQRIVHILVIRKGMVADPVIRLVHWLSAFAVPIGVAAIATFVAEDWSAVPACVALVSSLNYALLIFTGRALNDYLLGVRVERKHAASTLPMP